MARACPGSARMGRGAPYSSSPVSTRVALWPPGQRQGSNDQREGVKTRGLTDRPDGGRVPARREPQHADARRRAAAVQEAGGRRPQLRARDVRADARRRRDRAAVPQAPLPLGQDGRPAGLAARRAVRHRAPRPAQRAAQARPGPRAARAVLAAAQHPARVGAPAVGGARHRGPARRPGRDVHQDPPRPGRRRLRDAAAAERPHHRPRPARHAGTLGGAQPGQGRARPARTPSAACPRCRSRRCAPRWASPPRPPACPAR